VITLFPLPQSGTPTDITTGPGGALWFTEFAGNRLGRITTAGAIDETTSVDGVEPEGIASGPNGNIWFTEFNTSRIGEFILPPTAP